MAADSLPSLKELRILRLPAVLEATPLSKSRIYQLERAGEFPKRVSLGDNSVGWREIEIRQWLADRIANGKCTPQGALAPKPAKPAKATRKGARV